MIADDASREGIMPLFRIYLAVILVSQYSIGLGQNLSPEKILSISEFPAEITVDLGEIARGEETVKKIAIKNLTKERLSLAGSRTDCACALGYLKNKTIPHDGEIEVDLKVTPAAVGDFRRTVTLICNEGSARRIAINVHATSVPRFSINPSVIRLPNEGVRVIKLTVFANLDTQFANPRVNLSIDSIFQSKIETISERKLEVSLVLKGSAEQLMQNKRSLSYERLAIAYDAVNEAVFEVPISLERVPEIRPSTFFLEPGENSLRFFLFGDFDIPIEQLKASIVRANIDGRWVEFQADWRSERLGIVNGSVSTETLPPGKTVGQLQIWRKGVETDEVLIIGSITLET